MEAKTFDFDTPILLLLKEVEQGQTITITRHGEPVAQLVPMRKPRKGIEETIEEVIAFRKQHPLEDMRVKDLIEEGRRF